MRRALFMTAALLALSLLGAGAGAAAAPPPPLRLLAAALPPATARAAAAQLGAAGPGAPLIVQFPGPVGPAERAAIAAAGARIVAYLPDYAYLVDGPPAALAAAAALPGLARAVALPPAARLAPALLGAVAAGAGAGPLRLVAWPGQERLLAAELAAAGIDPAAPLGPAALRRLAALPALGWAEPAGAPRLLNDVARGVMGVDAAAWERSGLYGAGQVVAVADSGLDTGDAATLSADFAGRIVATQVLSTGGDLEDENGHGTHVAGSVAGSGALSGADPAAGSYAGSHAGVAPRAGLVIQAFEADAAGAIQGLPADYYQLFQQARGAGARLSSNSWGDTTGPADDAEAAYGGYPYGSQRADAFVWDHPDTAIFFAAGNSGADGTPGALGFCTGGDGVVDPDSLLAPATAKNVITVGATESQRPEGAGAAPWLLLNFCFASGPIAADPIADNPAGMAAFSSRGPTDDGRIKPDIVAPGTNIISSRTHAPGGGTLWGAADADYSYSGGTSMATPLVAGAGAIVREWLGRAGATSPSAALIKAVLLNTARDIAPGQYGAGPAQEVPATTPNSVAGWGRADLGFLGAAAPFAIWYDDHGALSTGAAVRYAHSAERPLRVVAGSDLPLRVQLVWTDPPASLAAARQLVNDLDLVLTGPDGTVYRGNGAAGGDRLNNVEGVVLRAPPAGDYTLRVEAHNVPIAEQAYALVVSGPLSAGQAQQVSFPAPAGARYGAPVALAASASSGLAVEYSVVAGEATVSGATLTPLGAGPVTLRARQPGNGTFAPAEATVSFSVARAALTAAADDKARAAGAPNPPLSVRYAGFVGADGPARLDVAPTASTSATAASPPGSYPISVGGGQDDDYSFTYVAGTLRVSAAGGPRPVYLPLLRR